MTRRYFVWVLVASMLAAGACKAPKENIVLRGINIKSVAPEADGNTLLTADAIFFNPNPGRMRLKGIAIDVLLDGKKAANVDQKLSTLITGNSEFTVPLEIHLNLKEVGLVDTLLSLFGGKKYGIQYVGKIKASVRGYPLNIPVDFHDELKF
jgi:LEA14-like dessication related protein